MNESEAHRTHDTRTTIDVSEREVEEAKGKLVRSHHRLTETRNSVHARFAVRLRHEAYVTYLLSIRQNAKYKNETKRMNGELMPTHFSLLLNYIL